MKDKMKFFKSNYMRQWLTVSSAEGIDELKLLNSFFPSFRALDAEKFGLIPPELSF